MFKKLHKVSRSTTPEFNEQHRFEHWHVDNQIYFITARCRDRFQAFASQGAKDIFWDRFTHWTREHGFTPWVTSLIPNHYHTIGYLKVGANLTPMMQRIHGSVAKLVNDELVRMGSSERRKEFWRDAKGREYFDGCIRDEKQARLAFRYTLTQGVRHGLVKIWEDYSDTRVGVQLERAIIRSKEIGAFLEGVPYKRYLQKRRTRPLKRGSP